MASDDLSGMMGQLPGDAQARVRDALRASIDKELAAAGGPAALRAGFSRGVFFSKSGGGGVRALEDEIVLPVLTQLSDDEFKKFAQRLAVLKGTPAPGG